MKPIRLIPALLLILTSASAIVSCLSEDEQNWNDYADWRNANTAWLAQQEASGLYEKIVPSWDTNSYVLMRWKNDRRLTAGNLTPMSTSAITAMYHGSLYDGTGFDSTYTFADSVLTFNLSGTVDGWIIAMEQMHVGDSVEVIIPYGSGYGATGTTGINPFSTLVFQIYLKDIAAYEIPN